MLRPLLSLVRDLYDDKNVKMRVEKINIYCSVCDLIVHKFLHINLLSIKHIYILM